VTVISAPQGAIVRIRNPLSPVITERFESLDRDVAARQ